MASNKQTETHSSVGVTFSASSSSTSSSTHPMAAVQTLQADNNLNTPSYPLSSSNHEVSPTLALDGYPIPESGTPSAECKKRKFFESGLSDSSVLTIQVPTASDYSSLPKPSPQYFSNASSAFKENSETNSSAFEPGRKFRRIEGAPTQQHHIPKQERSPLPPFSPSPLYELPLPPSNASPASRSPLSRSPTGHHSPSSNAEIVLPSASEVLYPPNNSWRSSPESTIFNSSSSRHNNNGNNHQSSSNYERQFQQMMQVQTQLLSQNAQLLTFMQSLQRQVYDQFKYLSHLITSQATNSGNHGGSPLSSSAASSSSSSGGAPNSSNQNESVLEVVLQKLQYLESQIQNLVKEKYPCPICNKTFTLSHNLKRHIKESHEGKPRSTKRSPEINAGYLSEPSSSTPGTSPINYSTSSSSSGSRSPNIVYPHSPQPPSSSSSSSAAPSIVTQQPPSQPQIQISASTLQTLSQHQNHRRQTEHTPPQQPTPAYRPQYPSKQRNMP